MFTLKLFKDAPSRSVRYVTVDQLTVSDEGPYLRSIACHGADPADADVYFVGALTHSTAFASAPEGRVFDRAVVENAEGHTTEVIRVRAIPPASEALRSPQIKSSQATVYPRDLPAGQEAR